MYDTSLVYSCHGSHIIFAQLQFLNNHQMNIVQIQRRMIIHHFEGIVLLLACLIEYNILQSLCWWGKHDLPWCHGRPNPDGCGCWPFRSYTMNQSKTSTMFFLIQSMHCLGFSDVGYSPTLRIQIPPGQLRSMSYITQYHCSYSKLRVPLRVHCRYCMHSSSSHRATELMYPQKYPNLCIKLYETYTAKVLFHQSPTRHSDYTVTTTVTM